MSDNTSTVKRPSHITPDTKVANETKSKPMNILEQFPNAVGTKKNADGTTTVELAQPSNRAQRRAMAKRNKKIQAKQQKRIMDYIKKHPEAIKVELDEDKISELEKEEAFVTGMTMLDKNGEPIVSGGEFVTTVSKRIENEPIDEVCPLTEEEKNSVIANLKPITKTNIVDVDFKEVKE